LLEFGVGPETRVFGRFAKHGKVFKARLLGQNMVVIADNAAIRR
jgi:hypothetical protein